MGKATEFSGEGAHDDDQRFVPVLFTAAQQFAKIEVVQRDHTWPDDRVKITHANGVVLMDVQTAQKYIEGIADAINWIEMNV